MTKVEIINLLKKTKRVLLITKDLGEDYYDTTARKCEKFGVEGVRAALENWIVKNKFMPRTSELIDECQNQKNFYDSKTPTSPRDSICKYFYAEEHEISRSLCQKNKIDDEDVFISNLQFGKTLCAWHYQCAYAKKHPCSTIAQFVKIHLKNTRKFQNSGSDGPKYERKGLNDAVFTKMNTNGRGGVRNGGVGRFMLIFENVQYLSILIKNWGFDYERFRFDGRDYMFLYEKNDSVERRRVL